MTEAEWLACDDSQRMLEYLRGKASERKLRLFACACCRRIWRFFPGDSRGRAAVVGSERFADGLAKREELRAARKRARHCEAATTRLNAFEAAEETAGAAAYEVRLLAIDFQGRDPILAGYTTHTAAGNRISQEESQGQCVLLRDIFGSPFAPVAVIDPAWLAWNSGTVPRLAQAIYEERAFDRLPILADALEDAGCTDERILSHCRSGGEHVRGCWVIDLLLGKQ